MFCVWFPFNHTRDHSLARTIGENRVASRGGHYSFTASEQRWTPNGGAALQFIVAWARLDVTVPLSKSMIRDMPEAG